MSWELKWEGRATDFVPDLLLVSGSPGAVAHYTKTTLWELIQSAGERNPHAWVEVVAQGWEEKSEPGSGAMALTFKIAADSPSEISQAVRAQQPIDLLRRPAAETPA